MNGDALVDAVGAILNIGDPDTDSTPTSADIVIWLNQAQDMIARNAPEADLQTLVSSDAGTYSEPVALTNGLRATSVRIDTAKCTYASPADFSAMTAAVAEDIQKSVWTYAPNDSADDPKVMLLQTSGTYNIMYIKRPASLTDAASRAVCTVDVIYDQILILYAVAMAKIQDEEMADAQYLFQLIGSMLGRSGLPDEALTRR